MSSIAVKKPVSAEERVDLIRKAFPKSGLFADKKWRISPDALVLPKQLIKELKSLGHLLSIFQKASNVLYHQSVKGKAPKWLCNYLDAGKPSELIEQGRNSALRDSLPRIIRPDLILTENGFAITELDSLPGGIGLTAWLNKTYTELGNKVLGSGRGMLEGFVSILPKGADIIISKESIDYLPEMEWLSNELNADVSKINFEVLEAEHYKPRGRAVYRFFELFDLENIPPAKELFEAAVSSEIDLTAPFKPYIEEKMWSALFCSRPLRDFWTAQMRESHWQRLASYFPFSWIIDPAPIPHHAELPGLGITDWRQLTEFSKKERALVLKMSGFSELAWGSRSVCIGTDMSANEWGSAVESAITDFPEQPWIMQKFKRARVFEHSYWDDDRGEIQKMDVRARLCPYYFLSEENSSKPSVRLGGVLATLVPSDKKIIHGMSDAILVPCVEG